MVSITCLVATALAATATPDDTFSVAARMPDGPLTVGATFEINVTYQVAPETSAAAAGIPAPLLQIQPGDSVELIGDVLRTRKQLSRNEFLEAPFERLLKKEKTAIPFKLVSKPSSEDAMEFNVVAYLTDAGGEQWFVRKRLRLPLRGGAVSESVAHSYSDWGRTPTLQIGQKAKAFRLVAADGETVALADYLGHKNVVVTTYRAHW